MPSLSSSLSRSPSILLLGGITFSLLVSLFSGGLTHAVMQADTYSSTSSTPNDNPYKNVSVIIQNQGLLNTFLQKVTTFQNTLTPGEYTNLLKGLISGVNIRIVSIENINRKTLLQYIKYELILMLKGITEQQVQQTQTQIQTVTQTQTQAQQTQTATQTQTNQTQATQTQQTTSQAQAQTQATQATQTQTQTQAQQTQTATQTQTQTQTNPTTSQAQTQTQANQTQQAQSQAQSSSSSQTSTIPPVPVLRLVGATNNTKTVGTGETLAFSWNTSGATSYVLKLSIPGTNILKELPTTESSWSGTMAQIGMTSGTANFSIKSCNANGQCSVYGNEVSVRIATVSVAQVNQSISSTESSGFHSEYFPLVVTPYLSGGFRENLRSDNHKLVEIRPDGTIRLQSTGDSGMKTQKYRVFLPPGTTAINGQITAALGKETKVITSFQKPPIGTIVNNTSAPADMMLEELIKGKEVTFYSSDIAGGVGLGTAGNNPIQIKNGGWLYINILSISANIIMSTDMSTRVDKSCYDKWFNDPKTKWDTDGNPAEGYNHTCDANNGTVMQ